MDEPTDRSLKLQGLGRREYDMLSQEGKAVIASRSRRITELSNIALAAELLNSLAEADETSRVYVAEALDGKHPDFMEKLRRVIDDYVESDVETNIRDYYKIKYGKAGIVALSASSTIVGDELAAQKDAEDSKTHIKPKTASVIEYIESEDTSKPTPQTRPDIGVGGNDSAVTVQPTDPEERRSAIAAILSRWEKRSLESIMRSESDVIGYVMTVSDENKAEGMTDQIVCMACEAMIKSKIGGVEFYREALTPANRESLLQIARAFKK